MGFFSWKTCDTNESIANDQTDRCRPVYMLQPDGKPAIYEPSYSGYGKLAGVDCYEWLGRMNKSELGITEPMSEQWLVTLGISLDVGSVVKRVADGALFSVFMRQLAVPTATHLPIQYSVPCDEFGGLSVNAALEQGLAERIEVSEQITVPYPLKFSFNPDAIYEDFGPSSLCEYQGFFYDDDEAEE